MYYMHIETVVLRASLLAAGHVDRFALENREQRLRALKNLHVCTLGLLQGWGRNEGRGLQPRWAMRSRSSVGIEETCTYLDNLVVFVTGSNLPGERLVDLREATREDLNVVLNLRLLLQRQTKYSKKFEIYWK